ncbi:hypothetical protein DAPPUDRAFT_326596 [Daphnia pulex]|uniref:Uncharacterized protein n=1 Tax=Daphnia pulex TaxID=6669 RepID=E9H877_DAPPU|nr:hypothetical protein DAPPUDRAFT_326596 [Daphnia pulex]|eukprot:EFX72075.1 hypothetical protein DAPPUDRAFT_326596 [Daphnia pulex]
MLPGTYRATCIVHTLQLVVGDAMKAMSGLVSQSALAAVEHASKIVNFVRKSVLDTETVYKSVGFHLLAKNATRYHSQLRMISALFKAIDKYRKLQSKLNATKKWDWAVLAAVKAELEMRAQQLKSNQPNLTEEVKSEPSQNPSGGISAAVIEEFENFIN